jgi:hypothetical protein
VSAEAELRLAAARLLDVAGDFQPNPAYAGGTEAPPEEEL